MSEPNKSQKFLLESCYLQYTNDSYTSSKLIIATYSIMLHVLILILENYCFQPKHRVLSCIRNQFGKDWKYVCWA